MTTFAEIQKQIAQLQQQAAELRAAELDTVIREVKEKITTFGLTADDLGLKLEPTIIYKEPEIKAKRAVIPPKFKHPENEDEVWTGQGIMPKWMVKYLEANKDKTKYDLLIDQSKREEMEKADKKKAEDKLKAENTKPVEAAPVEAVEEPKVETKVEKKPASKAEEIKTEDVKIIEPAVVQTKRFFGR